MRTFTKISVMAAALVALAVLAQPVFAACGSAATLSTIPQTGTKSYIWTEGVFTPNYYAPYVYDFVPPVSSSFGGTFWRLTSGDPVIGLGDDNGAYDFVADGGFYFYGPGGYGSYFAGNIFSGWGASAAVDGCITTAGSCSCILLSDEVNGQGMFALVSAAANSTLNTELNQAGTDGSGNGGPIILQAVPDLTIVNTAKAGIGVDLDVTIASLGGGLYEKDGCACGPIGYRVLAQQLAEGSPPPTSRDKGDWAELQLVGGGDQSFTPIGTPVAVNAACDNFSGVDLYVATELVFDSDFTQTVVSANSTRVVCGSNPTLADPDDFDRPRAKPDKIGNPSQPQNSGRRGR